MDMAAMKKMMTENPDMGKAGMEEWKVWMQNHMKDMADMGAPLGKNTEMSAGGAMEKSNDLGGYSIIQAETMEDVKKILADNPHFKMSGATMDIAELMPMAM